MSLKGGRLRLFVEFSLKGRGVVTEEIKGRIQSTKEHIIPKQIAQTI